MVKKKFKHKHWTPNPIIAMEEDLILASVDKTLASSCNAQTIGRNGEVPLRNFLKRYLPNVLRVETGHFLSAGGIMSPQIDVMILDSRYPLLAENNDGSVLAMLHSVVATIEVKTRITKDDLANIWGNSSKIWALAADIFGDCEVFGNIKLLCFAYRSKNRFDTLADNYFEIFKNIKGYTDLYLLRLPEPDQTKTNKCGAFFHFEPEFGSKNNSKVTGYIPTVVPQYTPLSDLYYDLIQDSYYCLNTRGYDLGDIGEHIMLYMAWSTTTWKKRKGK